MRPGIAIVGLWAVWALSWLVAAAWSDRSVKSAGATSELRHRIPTYLGALLLFVPAHGYDGPLRLWHVGRVGAWACAAVVAAGFAFAWWARLHLGKLWSAHVARKADHRVVESGPYGIVRHPIYTGLLLSLLATAVAKGTVPGILGFAAVLAGLRLKARIEEQWLEAELGAAYGDYRRRVPMLLPFATAAH
jgi:protein-S-isoprenylcysteine O-methyltransferase Ste14